MNTARLKVFAPAIRRQLIEAVTRKLDFVLSAQTPDYVTTFSPQVSALRRLAEADREGLLERVSYTWFNRFTALRYLDAKGWHPFRARVLTPASAEETQPELLKLTRNGTVPEELKRHTNPARLNDLLDGRIPTPDPQGEVYRHLVLAACRFYNALLPDLFEKLDDATELLLPDDLLTEHSVVQGFRTEISDGDCAEVEILGWLYQFYISEKKDEVMARKKAVPTEDIPAVTQLFTPHWIVRYLVENSLGRLWLLNRPGSKLREHMPYYIEGDAESDFLKITKPEEIRLCDPAVGSGHMLSYAFDLLSLIYEEEGYAPADIPALILRHNLYGLEICPRAAQLAELSLAFKAREKSRRFFQPEHIVRPNIIELREVRFTDAELADYFKAIEIDPVTFIPNTFDFSKLLRQFEEGKNFGSLIQPCLDEQAITFARRAIETKDLSGQLFLRETHLKVLRVLEQAEALTQRYHVVVANPPYMGSGAFNLALSAWLKDQFPASKADLFAAFTERNLKLTVVNGFSGLIVLPSWLFLATFEKLRVKIISEVSIQSMLHMGRGIFGIDWGSTAFILKNSTPKSASAVYFRLHKRNFQHLYSDDIEKLFLNAKDDHTYRFNFDTYREDSNIGLIDKESHPAGSLIRYEIEQAKFIKIPGIPIAYWASSCSFLAFDAGISIGDIADCRDGLTTGDNDAFLRFWHEVAFPRISVDSKTRTEASECAKRWFPCNKGGPFRKWYGNRDIVIDWERDGQRLRSFVNVNGKPRATLRNSDYYFRSGLTWSDVSSSSSLGVRISPEGGLFETAGPTLFCSKIRETKLLQFLCSAVASHFMTFINSTLHCKSGNVAALPWREVEDTERIGEVPIALARADWDNFETSWDFFDQPLLRPGLKGSTLEASWRNWEAHSTAAIRRMQELETENNRLFIAAYGLDGELQPEVPEDQITLARAEARRDMAAFLSYAVGCMMGRYALDHPGLILANASDTVREFLAKVERPPEQLTFAPDEDGIIPVLDGEWFEDDIVARTREFLRATFGEATLRENLRFIEDSLGKDLRKYFLTDFYKDHLQTYKKRPIYWLIQSPKRGFNALLYLHRYSRDTMNLVLNRYLREYQVKLRNRIEHLAHAQINESIKASDKTAARKEADRLTKILRECEEWERQIILPLAQQRIELDLDDGVKINYLKLGEALAPIPGLAAAEE